MKGCYSWLQDCLWGCSVCMCVCNSCSVVFTWLALHALIIWVVVYRAGLSGADSSWGGLDARE